jgi:hypothetical protein
MIFFGTFIKWRAFSKWRKSVSAKKFGIVFRSLPLTLLAMDNTLRPTLITCQDICFKLKVMGLGKELDEGPVTLVKFIENQVFFF